MSQETQGLKDAIEGLKKTQESNAEKIEVLQETLINAVKDGSIKSDRPIFMRLLKDGTFPI